MKRRKRRKKKIRMSEMEINIKLYKVTDFKREIVKSKRAKKKETLR